MITLCTFSSYLIDSALHTGFVDSEMDQSKHGYFVTVLQGNELSAKRIFSQDTKTRASAILFHSNLNVANFLLRIVNNLKDYLKA